ncbi:MAG: hypothetical protein PF590_10915 [Candidatus Delongbacteria bacterium]|jgi:hypothetical protein|nr:hypothetical protein [Candidatus Delongbacteria bacterium]
MSDNNTYFDDFLKSQIENQKIEGNKASKAAFVKKAARYRFWHLFPLSFNVYYLVLILVVLIVGSVYFSTNVTNETEKYQPESSHDVFDMELNLPDDEMKKPYNTVDGKSDKPKKPKHPMNSPVIETKNHDDNRENQGSDQHDELMDTINTHETQHVDNNQNESENVNQNINETEQKDTAPVIDTVVREKRVQHTDTIKKEIKKTIEIKKDREKRRHR